MRLLIDEYVLPWDEAWSITCKTFAYTNHTLLPEALERWPLEVFGSVPPRHLQIILEINAHFLEEVRIRFLGDEERIRRMSLIEESGARQLRMAHLACVGSHAINGVADLHTELLKRDVLKDFYELWPRKFSNKTNGVTPRRWMVLSNPQLSDLITEHIGDGWIKDLAQLKRLEPLAEDADFRARWREIKQHNKRSFAALALKRTGVVADPNSMFDVLVKRIHEYKRQHLQVLHIVSLYHSIKSNPSLAVQPRTFIFGGKAAPGYHLAKLMIRSDHGGRRCDQPRPGRARPASGGIPAQLQRDQRPARISGRRSVGADFHRRKGGFRHRQHEILHERGAHHRYARRREHRAARGNRRREFLPVRLERAGGLCAEGARLPAHGLLQRQPAAARGDRSDSQRLLLARRCGLFRPLIDSLMHYDPYMLFADFESYVEAQAKVSEAYGDAERWTRMSILNTARSGKFSSDRTIREYCADIWRAKAVPINLLTHEEAGSA